MSEQNARAAIELFFGTAPFERITLPGMKRVRLYRYTSPGPLVPVYFCIGARIHAFRAGIMLNAIMYINGERYGFSVEALESHWTNPTNRGVEITSSIIDEFIDNFVFTDGRERVDNRHETEPRVDYDSEWLEID